MSRAAATSPRRLRYADAPADGEIVLRRFSRPDPIQLVAASVEADAGDLALAIEGGETVQPVRAAIRDFAAVTWRGATIEIRRPGGRATPALPAVLAFDHLMRETAAVESAVAALEPLASGDVSFSFRIRWRDRAQWDRQLATLERLARMRLILAQLGAMAEEPPGDLTRPAARLYAALCAQAGLSDRLSRLGARLEALEDLYEGAVDRINDHMGWRQGHLMELVIVAVLIAEVVLLLLKR